MKSYLHSNNRMFGKLNHKRLLDNLVHGIYFTFTATGAKYLRERERNPCTPRKR